MRIFFSVSTVEAPSCMYETVADPVIRIDLAVLENESVLEMRNRIQEH
jgi:hypothetical protein